jgi:hypothetical protein
MGILKVERVGGFAGFGGPHLKSRGELAFSKLSPADQKAVEALFAGHGKTEDDAIPDGFIYRITRAVGGKPKTITAPESLVPMALQSSVKDMLE